jgi:hypothetical protein
MEVSVDLTGLGPGRYSLDVRMTSSHTLGLVRAAPRQVQIFIR